MADQGNEGLLSPFLRRQRIAAARPFLVGRVLDVGCGSGALAGLVPAERYVGVDVDDQSLERARRAYPEHRFRKTLPPASERFDTIVALAVIEHVADPRAFLAELAARLDPSAQARIACTTPHPWADRLHDVGAAIGLFSRHANEEHEDLLDRAGLAEAGAGAGLELIAYKRFLALANQLAVFQRSGAPPAGA